MGASEPLTDRQSEILKLVRDLTESSGFPPTRAEIAEKMGFRSVNAAEQHLRALEKKGALEILQGASRGLRVKDKAAARLGRLMDLPVVGRVAAGSPMLAVHRTQEARTGQVVVARLADEVTVKRFRRKGHSVQLVAENPDFAPIEVDLRRDALTIEGVAVGVIRNGKSL
jgi:repressor LexA